MDALHSTIKKWLRSILIPVTITVGVAAASIAFAALTFSGSGITGSSSGVAIDSSSTISIGTSTATGVTVGNGNATTTLIGTVFASGTVAINSALPATLPLEIHNTSYQAFGVFSHTNTSWAGPAIGIYRSQGTQIAPSAIAAPDNIGYFNFEGYDGSSYVNGAQITAQIGTNWTTTNHNTTLIFNTVPAETNNTVEVFRMGSNSDNGGDANGNLSRLDLIVTGGHVLGFNSNGAPSDSQQNAGLSEYNPGVIAVGNGSSTDFSGTLLANKIGLGTSTPATSLQVTGSSTIRVGVPASPFTGCLEMYDSVNTSTLEYIYTANGVLTATTTKPSFCQ